MLSFFHVTDKVVKIVLIALSIAMVIFGFAQVFFRYVMQNSLTWSEELIRYMFIWSTFLAVPVGIDRGIHASFDLLSKKISAKNKAGYQLLILIMTAFLFVIFIYAGFSYAFSNINQRTPALLIPYTYVILSVPVGGLIGLIYVTKNVLKIIRRGGE